MYSNLSNAIADSIDGGRSVPCIRLPALFDRVEQDTGGRPAGRARVQSIGRDLCAACPVIEQCRAYIESSGAVHGFAAGAWRHG